MISSDNNGNRGKEGGKEIKDKKKATKSSNQGEGTTCSRDREDIPGPELEARIIRLEKLIAQLEAKRLGG
ncbi:hypothetical protein RHGRI_025597 [Rhododendron griersonianum]|uniref:Dehydrin n=1 Tax=Rhododendron griersonianum TaxID=479676 RepID=A0AAV6IV28_9ERIC|nr:hypothetical protein RHGRI_025597 [Rhododendron griersonianum]